MYNGMVCSNDIQHTVPSGDNTESGCHRVLFVDDEAAICFAYRKFFENELFRFDVCESVETALVLLKRNAYFAIISDVRFEGSGNEDGVYLASVVRKLQPNAKVILVTGYGDDELEKTAYALGVHHYFEKPVMPSTILSVLSSMRDTARTGVPG
jgi:DNA-binding NtrC family response regulator